MTKNEFLEWAKTNSFSAYYKGNERAMYVSKEAEELLIAKYTTHWRLRFTYDVKFI